eukprot:TRINITY_DN2606_c0_g1_i4.p1 TRINITY_DN2606_c0_g1~~TRINITY_DN2606_c0_g1_i4.p1  ORF type:complete len:164 (+),score=23.85 TRINITY_DN2606_c0_g1_i4:54-494(+)
MSNFDIVEQFHKITQPWLQGPDWEGTIHLIDLLNEDPKRMGLLLLSKIAERLKDDDPKVVWLALIVVSTCVTHGPRDFVANVATESFMQVIYKIFKKRWVRRKREDSLSSSYKNWCGELAAHMIRQWAYKGKREGQFPIFISTYRT